MIWQPSHCRKLSKVTEKGQKVANNGLGVLLPGRGMTLEMWAMVPCVEQAVCAVHTCSSLPWCWGQASSKSGRGEPV